MAKFKYSAQVMQDSMIDYIAGTFRKKINYPSNQLVKYWLKRENALEQLIIQNEELLNKTKEFIKLLNKDKISTQMDSDDTYNTFRVKGKFVKKMIRLRIIRIFANDDYPLKGKKQNPKKPISMVAIYDIRNLGKSADNHKAIKVINEFNSQTGLINNKMAYVCDGARALKLEASILGMDYHLDLFHLIQNIDKYIGYKKHSKNTIKNLFIDYFSPTKKERWIDLLTKSIKENDYELYKEILDELEDLRLSVQSKSIKKNITSLLTYLKSKNSGIWDNQTRKAIVSYTENNINYHYKKLIKNSLAHYTEQTTKMKVLFSNLQKNIPTIFI
ncbi:Mbov_0401 family ICE element transposase-like protein [Mycoplasma crocodyli]|uniref:Transposase n=1 Tax=Mycoplasma crocodyli (strain ATCC 51981 / MP145) TaxID=512564 RepID=D5E5C0_MYCCM|nr:hypothetical protein [Mycoplasma crocodyli]ADE19773.1 conserved hypothetical protein [Mycoplasma crocodyli MP145]